MTPRGGVWTGICVSARMKKLRSVIVERQTTYTRFATLCIDAALASVGD
jgi:hypothetical protein